MEEFNIKGALPQVKAWALKERAVCYLLQMDPVMEEQEQHFNQLHFMVVASDVERLWTHTYWVDNFGTPSRLHKASHGFCHVVKASYGRFGSINFVLVPISPQDVLYRFQEGEALEADLKLLVQKEVF